MKLTRITEVGVAVPDLEKATRLFVERLGARPGEIVTVKRYGMRYRMCRVGNVDFELMEPLSDDSVIASFLRSRGPGLHHVAFAVDDLGAVLDILAAKGSKLIDREPRSLHGGRYAFVHPSSFEGVMLELIEYPEGAVLPGSPGGSPSSKLENQED
ncbi:MAG: VOC family protein [Deltaproteobacteria bacterium]|nr:VOC family protein [Deltaproteobacteria bacterium]MBW1923165.1 VOC family protein [Deltaproteobacteria bacterium]MBW1949286.1 VOC family protein [Deltaproteobacteria bacterium]MBW2007720.1 VOC family protein [Deltaproteobacteria bacterium]MBW2103396.1 VOC family protein [Deltaproteobacteria bacterium]